MPPARFRSPYPPLDLSIDEREELSITATQLIDDAQAMYENNIWSHHSAIDAARWSLVKSKDNVRVYRDKRPGGGTPDPNMHLILAVGTVNGNLHDAMYGVLNHTTNDMRIKTAYIEDTLVDCAVLETILEPTIDDPFQSMTIRWYVKGIPFFVRPIAKHPDNVYLEATGIKTLSNGERVGFHLMHSIASKQTPLLPQYDRFNSSFCTMWRQANADNVEVFTTTYMEIKDNGFVPASVIIKSLSEALVSFRKIIECAQMKKLTYLVSGKSTRWDSQSSDECVVCDGHLRSTSGGVRPACAICGNAVCKKCRIKKQLAFFAPSGDLLHHQTHFCVSCFTAASRLDALAVAQAEVTARDLKQRNQESHGGSSSLTMSLVESKASAPFF